MKIRIHVMVMLCVLLVGAVQVSAQDDGNVVTGYITSISTGDQSYTRGLSKWEREFPVRVTITSVQGTVLGFGEYGESIVAQQAMLDLLMKAMENRWEVSLLLRREVSDSRGSSRIVSVTAVPKR